MVRIKVECLVLVEMPALCGAGDCQYLRAEDRALISHSTGFSQVFKSQRQRTGMIPFCSLKAADGPVALGIPCPSSDWVTSDRLHVDWHMANFMANKYNLASQCSSSWENYPLSHREATAMSGWGEAGGIQPRAWIQHREKGERIFLAQIWKKKPWSVSFGCLPRTEHICAARKHKLEVLASSLILTWPLTSPPVNLENLEAVKMLITQRTRNQSCSPSYMNYRFERGQAECRHGFSL